MKRLLLSCALSAFAFAPAMAADAVIYDPAPAAAPVAVYDWSGLYVGLQAGYGWSEVDQPWGAVGGPFIFTQDNADGDGWLGGVHLGYNHQVGSWVFGLEGDIEASNVDGDDGGSGGHINGFEFEWMASARGRLGFAVDRLLLYGTAGYAFMHGSAYAVPGFGGAVAESDSESFHGWTAGAGAEYAFTDNLTVRAEYRYADFGAERVTFPVNGYDEEIDPSIHAVRIGVSYKF